jgi:hypothetical protein
MSSMTRPSEHMLKFHIDFFMFTNLDVSRCHDRHPVGLITI